MKEMNYLRVGDEEFEVADKQARADRFIGATEKSTLAGDEYLLVNNVSEGTKKIKLKDVFDSEFDPSGDFLRKYNSLINDAWLTANNITDARQLEKNRVYLLSGVTKSKLANMPSISATTYNGSLIIFDQMMAAGIPIIFIDNVGKCWTGIWHGAKYSIRWMQNAIQTDIDSLVNNIQNIYNTAFRRYGVNITDTWLTNNNINDVRSFPEYSYSYIIQNVTKSKLANMPSISATAYNGTLLIFRQWINAAHALFFIDNTGECWTGTDTGSEIRWKNTTFKSLDNVLSGLQQKRILLLGDSIVYGSHMSDYSAGSRTVVTLQDGTVYKNNLSTTVWSAKLIDYLSTNYDAVTVNNAWPGAKYQDLITYFDQIVTQGYDYVFICLGVNNWSSGGSVLSSLEALKTKFDERGTQMIVLVPLGSTTYASELGHIRSRIKGWGRIHNIEVGDLYSAFNYLNHIKGRTLSDVLIDGVHYTDASQIDIYEAAKRALHI